MLRGALHIAVVFSFLWLPLNRRHNIELVYPAFEVVGWADGVYVPLHSWRRDVQRKAVELGMNATYQSSRSKFASSMIGRPPLPDLTSHVVVPSHVTAAKWKPFLKAVIAKICAASATPVGFILMGADAKKLAGAVTAAHVVVQCDFPGQWTGGAAALDTARPFQAIDNALQARIQWDVLVR